MGEPKPVRDPRRDPDRPVVGRRDHSVDALGLGQPVQRRLVLERDQRAPVGVPEAGSGCVAIDRHYHQPAAPGGRQQPELLAPGAEDEQAAVRIHSRDCHDRMGRRETK
jgi:hypothetical protein